MSKKNRIRVYVDVPLAVGTEVVLDSEQAHYLVNVLRLQPMDTVYLFNGKEGEFSAHITDVAKKYARLLIDELFLPFEKSPDIWLMFAPLKKDNTDLVVVKATELGVSKICPVVTEFTNASVVRNQRLQMLAVEASEQCRRQDIPQIEQPIKLQNLLADWDEHRILFYLDETGGGTSIMTSLQNTTNSAAFLVGPEGGFSQKELEILRNCHYTCPITLGKRILRAETAALAALSCWQACCGDWR